MALTTENMQRCTENVRDTDTRGYTGYKRARKACGKSTLAGSKQPKNVQEEEDSSGKDREGEFQKGSETGH